jgi:hypothetical protein
LELDLRVQAENENVEIPSIGGFVSLAKHARSQDSAQPRPWGQPRPDERQPAEEERKPDQDPFIEGPPTGLA